MRLIDAEPMPYGELWESLSNNEKLNVMLYLLQMPTVDAEPVRHGRWEDIKGAIRCSECQNKPLYDYHGRLMLTDWCHVCGAKMWKKRGEENGKGD